MFDRLRLLHRAAGAQAGTPGWLEAENEMLISLQLGLRERRLSARLQAGGLTPDFTTAASDLLQEFRLITRHPGVVAVFLRSVCSHLDEVLGRANQKPEPALGALADMWEMTLLLETNTRLYAR